MTAQLVRAAAAAAFVIVAAAVAARPGSVSPRNSGSFYLYAVAFPRSLYGLDSGQKYARYWTLWNRYGQIKTSLYKYLENREYSINILFPKARCHAKG